MGNDSYHIPVLLNEAVEALITDPDGLYVDVTFGGGGHSQAILNHLNNGKLIAFDQDKAALENIILDDRFSLTRQNFRNIQNVIEATTSIRPSGVLADLGVSSFQFDCPERGFSFRFNNRLDMRMNTNSDLDAYKLLKDYDEQQLENVFRQFGDFKIVESKKLSTAIINSRNHSPLETTFQLASVVEHLVPKKIRNQFLARVFQSIRIEVNQELSALSDFLIQLPKVLKKCGVICVITYHSLEDRLVKSFFKTGNCEGTVEKDFYGNISKPFTVINKKPITPTMEEIRLNPRARSAKLRIATKN